MLILAVVCAAVASVAAVPGPDGYSAPGLYNSANMHARQGSTALAILGYERALLLDPNDADARTNLAMVRSAAALAPVRETWFESHGRIAAPNRMYWACILGLVLTGSGASLLLFAPRRRRPGWLGVALGLPLCAAGVWNAAANWPLLHEAVVLRATVARVSPAATGDTLFALAEGQVVWQTDEFRGFVLIKADAGPAGWVAGADIAAVVPAAGSDAQPAS
jgi:hypothetical protein